MWSLVRGSPEWDYSAGFSAVGKYRGLKIDGSIRRRVTGPRGSVSSFYLWAISLVSRRARIERSSEEYREARSRVIQSETTSYNEWSLFFRKYLLGKIGLSVLKSVALHTYADGGQLECLLPELRDYFITIV